LLTHWLFSVDFEEWVSQLARDRTGPNLAQTLAYLLALLPSLHRLFRQEDADSQNRCDLASHYDQERPLENCRRDRDHQDR